MVIKTKHFGSLFNWVWKTKTLLHYILKKAHGMITILKNDPEMQPTV